MAASLRNLPLTVYYTGDGETAPDPVSLVAIAPDIIRWERNTGKAVSDLSTRVAMDDLVHIAYYAAKRTGHTDEAKLERWSAGVAWVDDDEPDEVDPTPPGH